jgi:hypothetical protein
MSRSSITTGPVLDSLEGVSTTKSLKIAKLPPSKSSLDPQPLGRGRIGRLYSGRIAPRRERHERAESEEGFTYDDLLKRDKVNLDIFWLRDESLENSANLPDPHALALEIAEELESALEQFAAIAEDLKREHL